MMKSLTRGVSLAALTLFAALPARAETNNIQHEAAGIQFDLPDGWKSEAEGEGVIRVKNADESVEVVLSVAKEDTLDAAVGKAVEEVGAYLKDAKLDGDGEPKMGKLNGTDIETASLSGSGTYEGEAWAWDITMFMAKKPVVILSWATPEVLKNPSEDVKAFFASVRKL